MHVRKRIKCKTHMYCFLMTSTSSGQVSLFWNKAFTLRWIIMICRTHDQSVCYNWTRGLHSLYKCCRSNKKLVILTLLSSIPCRSTKPSRACGRVFIFVRATGRKMIITKPIVGTTGKTIMTKRPITTNNNLNADTSDQQTSGF